VSSDWTRITVGGQVPQEVIVGAGAIAELPSLVGPGASTVMVIHPASLGEIAQPAIAALRQAGYQVRVEGIPDGEEAKDITVAARLWSALAQARLGRRDVIVGLGGGAATDLAGFTAASWLRGVRLVLVPTTLLAIVDAAVGGKTAVNIPEGKNLVGAFHPAAGVVADPDVLRSLPAAEYASGLAEVIKSGFIADPAILDLVQADPERAARPGGPAERELIERALAVKAEIVAADPVEAGRREMLNYGHTLGHAIEAAEGYRIRHGAAVSIGMVFAAAAARLAGRLDEATARRHREILAAAGLPVSYRPGAWPQLRERMAVDKKARAARLRFVVLDGLARPGILDDPPEDLLEQAYAEMSR
jgi:3-dehydroquinate synthase